MLTEFIIILDSLSHIHLLQKQQKENTCLNQHQSGVFLLRLSKLKQLGAKLLKNMETVQETPSIMDLKDKQQSKWSMEQREDLIKNNDDLLNHEKRMNVFFKEFYQNYLQKES